MSRGHVINRITIPNRKIRHLVDYISGNYSS